MRTKQSQKSAPIHEHFLGGKIIVNYMSRIYNYISLKKYLQHSLCLQHFLQSCARMNALTL